jgi:hypothetical protein
MAEGEWQGAVFQRKTGGEVQVLREGGTEGGNEGRRVRMFLSHHKTYLKSRDGGTNLLEEGLCDL